MYFMMLVLFMLVMAACGTGGTEQPPTFPTDSIITTRLNAFPTMHIRVNNPTLPFNRELWRDVSVSISGAADLIPETINVPALMRGRGNTSWSSSPDKRPFRLRFEETHQQMPFSNATARDWTFLSQHSDYTLLRDYIAFTLSHVMGGMTVAPFAGFMHVYIDGAYMGLYMNSIQVNDAVPCGDNGRRASLVRRNDPTRSEFMLERCYRGFNNPANRVGYELFFVGGVMYEIRFGRAWPEHNAYIRNFMYQVHTGIMLRNAGVFDLINFDSFVDWYVVHELFRDHDAGRTSSFMQLRLDENGRRYLELGPVWDFDHAAAGSNWQLPAHPYIIWVPHGNDAGRYAHQWFTALLEMPEFYNAVAARLREMRDIYLPMVLTHTLEIVEHYIQCFRRNFERHPVFDRAVMGMSRELTALNSFDEHLYFLINWLTIRADWLVGHFHGYSPYLNIEALQFQDATVAVGSDIRLIHINITPGVSSTTRGEIVAFYLYHNGTRVDEGVLMHLEERSVIFDLPQAALYHAGTYTLYILYTKRWQATEIMPPGAYAPVRRVSTRLRYGTVVLGVE